MPIKTQRGTTVKPQKIPTTQWSFLLFALFGDFAFPKSRLEFSNTTNLPAKIYANEGIAQMLFFMSDEICETSYRDRDGKYQGQKGVTLPKT